MNVAKALSTAILISAAITMTSATYASQNMKGRGSPGSPIVYVESQGLFYDSMCGISDEDIEHIFDRFYHAEQSENNDSTGLGLAIVKRILDLHGSRITVRSSPDQGTRFEFELPNQKPCPNSRRFSDQRIQAGVKRVALTWGWTISVHIDISARLQPSAS